MFTTTRNKIIFFTYVSFLILSFALRISTHLDYLCILMILIASILLIPIFKVYGEKGDSFRLLIILIIVTVGILLIAISTKSKSSLPNVVIYAHGLLVVFTNLKK